jgi:hypothetical protein
MSQARFIVRSLLICGIAIALIGVFNLLVNPYSEFSIHLVPPATTPMRILKMRVIDNLGQAPVETVILGSSRLQELDPEVVIPGTRGINLILQNPTMEDVYAIWRYLLKAHSPPQYVILGLEINMFKPGPMDEAGLYAIPELRSLVPWTLGEKVGYEFARFRRLFRLYVFLQSINQLRYYFSGKKPLLNIDIRGLPYLPGVPAIKEGNPTLELPPRVLAERNKKRRETMIWFREVKYRNFEKTGKQKYFEAILADTQKMKIPTLVFLTTMHPEMVELTKTHVPFEQWRDYVKTACGRYGAVFVDLSEYTEIPYLKPWDFIDNAHLSREGIALLADRLKAIFNEELLSNYKK